MITLALWIRLVPIAQILVAATVVIAIAWAISCLGPWRRAVAREWLWLTALVGVLASPLASLASLFAPHAVPALAILPAVPARSTEQEPALRALSQDTPVTSAAATTAANPTPAATPITAPEPADGAIVSSTPLIPVASKSPPASSASNRHATAGDRSAMGFDAGRLASGSVALIWMLGAFYYLSRGVIGARICRRIAATSRPLDEPRFAAELAELRSAQGTPDLPPIVVSSEIGSPAVIGVARPCIALPTAALESMSPRQLIQVLLHESAHIVRGDPKVNLLQLLARALFWPHPLIHWLNRRLSEAREDVCDNFVLAHCEAADYAETLLTMTEQSPHAILLGGLAMVPARGSLESRVTGLLDASRDLSVRFPLWRRLTMQSVLLLVPIMFGLVRVTTRAAEGDEPARSEKPASTKPAENSKTTEASEPKGSGRITGTVVRDKQGRGVAGADVTLLPPPPKGQDAYYGPLPLRWTKTDSQGKWGFDSLAPGRYRVWANYENLTSRPQRMKGETVVIPESAEAPQPVELRLITGVAVTVRVKEKSTGKAIPNATVHIGWSDLREEFPADRNGHVTLQPLTAERWFIETWGDGFAKESRWLNLENGKDAEAEFQLAPGGDLAGVVRDATGKTVAGAGLSVFAEADFHQILWTKTDDHGHYRLAHLPFNAALKIDVSKLDYLRQRVPMRLTEANQTTDFTLPARPHGGSIVGIVADEEGRPIAGAVLGNFGNSSEELREAKSGTDGRFRLENLYQGSVGSEVIIRAKKFAPRRLKVEPGPADKPAEVNISLEPGHRIRGLVEDDRGRALEGVTVFFDDGYWPFSGGGRTTTDKQGRFEFDSLPADCPFTFNKAGYSDIGGRRLTLDGDEDVAVEMVPSAVILGKVTDAKTRKPIRAFNVRITFSPQRGPNEPATGLRSDWINPGQAFQSDKGEFKLADLVDRMPLQMIIDAEGYERKTLERVVAERPEDAETVAFELDPVDPASLRVFTGRLLDAKQRPVAGAQLRLIAARDRKAADCTGFPFNWQMIRMGQLAQQATIVRFLEGTTNKEGRFEFTRIPRAAQVELVWWGDDIAPGRADHLETLGDAAGSEIEITLPVPARVKGRIDRKVYPRAGQIMILGSENGSDYVQVELKPDQETYEIGNLAPGSYTVALLAPPERSPGSNDGMTLKSLASTKIKLDEGKIEELDFTKELLAPPEANPRKATPRK